ncbi:FBP domain-containing protein [Gryllotalpicola ginsengisoli]|uniref:FBP domain-containing protein n=1 Tax=Gryllotalpicola ginsengisoli TaxID=444608 RepID=UPI0003B433AB|nr:FBP domain-containing protein [Gryllotalpicola ginsengisoli]
MRALTEDDIRGAFVNATDEQLQRMPLPGLHETLWDEREFLGWRDPQAAHLGYLVHWDEAEQTPVGIVVRAASGGMRAGIAAMCSFCHSPQPATQVRLFSTPRAGEAGRNGNTIGTYICEDLACSLLIRRAPAHLNPPQQVARRSADLLQRVQNFTADVMRTA